MPITFNDISNTRNPFLAIEFDGSKAQQGPSLQPFTILVMGQKTAAGSKNELSIDAITSDDQAGIFYGFRSQLYNMIVKLRANNKVTAVKAISIDDDDSGVAATGKITITAGAATKDGNVQLYIGAKRIPVLVLTGDDQDAVATAIVAAITANLKVRVTAVINGTNANEVDLTAANKGLEGNKIDLRTNFNSDDVDVAGIVVGFTPMSGGVTNPDVGEIISIMPEEQFNVIIYPWKDATSLTAIEAELLTRWGPMDAHDGMGITAEVDSHGALLSLGDSRNSFNNSIMGPAASAPNPPDEWAGAYGGAAARALEIDPARPLQTLQLKDILQPRADELFKFNERDLLLRDGIATAVGADGGVMRISRAITTFQTNAAGAPDTTFLDVNTPMTLSFFRFDTRALFARKFPRHKLAGNTVVPAPGQPIITPKVARGELVALASAWQNDLGLMEDLEQFIADLVVERDTSNPNRLLFLASPDLINQFRNLAGQFAFLL